jgi:predicted nucleic acid-binding protein
LKTYFFDTSALVKRYISEIGSYWVRTLTDPEEGNGIILARITWVEMLSAYSRLKRESTIDEGALNIAIQAFEYDWDTQYHIVEFDKTLAEQAGELVKKYLLRAYDSVQLASALRIHRVHVQVAPGLFVFVSSDDRLLAVAKSENMSVENPLLHSTR